MELLSWPPYMEADEYHATPALGSGAVRLFARSPRAFYERHVARATVDEIGPWADFGTVAHTLLLEPAKIAEVAEFMPTADKGIKAAFSPFFASIPKDKIQVKPDMLEAAKAVVPSLKELTDNVTTYLFESSVFWKESGLFFKARLDFWGCLGLDPRRVLNVMADFKTMRFVDNWRSAERSHGYHLQGAHNATAALLTQGVDAANLSLDELEEVAWFYFLCVGKQRPFPTRRRKMAAQTLYEAIQRRRELVSDIARRMDDGDWTDPEEYDVEEV